METHNIFWHYKNYERLLHTLLPGPSLAGRPFEEQAHRVLILWCIFIMWWKIILWWKIIIGWKIITWWKIIIWWKVFIWEGVRSRSSLRVVLFGDMAGAVEISLLYDVSTDPRKSSYKSYLPTNFVESSFRRLCGIIIPQTLRNHHMKMINPLTASPLKPQYEIGTTDSGGDLSLSIIWRFYWSTALRS